jgi:hypothetical protein
MGEDILLIEKIFIDGVNVWMDLWSIGPKWN